MFDSVANYQRLKGKGREVAIRNILLVNGLSYELSEHDLSSIIKQRWAPGSPLESLSIKWNI